MSYAPCSEEFLNSYVTTLIRVKARQLVRGGRIPRHEEEDDFGHIIHRRYGADGLEHETTFPLTAGVRIYSSNIAVFIRKGTTGEHVYRGYRYDHNANCLSPFSCANQVDFVCEIQQPGSVPARILGGGSAAVVPIR